MDTLTSVFGEDIHLTIFGWRFSWTSAKGTMTIKVQRQRKTTDGILGVLSLDGNPFTCFTLENLEYAIPAGLYSVEFTYSPAFNKIMPLINVPGRDGIRIHPANYPTQLHGCIALGDKEEPDAVDNSRVTFNIFTNAISGQEKLQIHVMDIKET